MSSYTLHFNCGHRQKHRIEQEKNARAAQVTEVAGQLVQQVQSCPVCQGTNGQTPTPWTNFRNTLERISRR